MRCSGQQLAIQPGLINGSRQGCIEYAWCSEVYGVMEESLLFYRYIYLQSYLYCIANIPCRPSYGLVTIGALGSHVVFGLFTFVLR
jgi:hypothetical protein